MNIPEPLVRAYLEAIRTGHTVVYAPVSQEIPGLSADRQTESQIDFVFEMSQATKMWNDPANGEGGQPGDLFAFVHLSEAVGGADGLLQFYQIKEVLPPSEGREHWHAEGRKGRHSNRNVLILGDFIGNMSFVDFKKIHGYKETFVRVAGTKRCNHKWADGIVDTLQALLPTDTQSGAAVLWTEQPKADTLDICYSTVRDLAIAGPSYKLYENSVRGAARTMDMLLDPASGGYGITIAELQSGKSGMAVLIASAFRRMLEARLNFQGKLAVVFVTHISDTNIKNQAIKDHFGKAGFEEQLFSSNTTKELFRNPIDDRVFLHIDMLSGGAFRDGKQDRRSRLSEAIQSFEMAGCEKMLVISDEVQVATDLDQQFERWLSSVGFSIKNSNPNLYMIGVTATATKFYTPLSDGNPVYICYNAPDRSVYYGLADMLDADRIVDIGDGIKDDIEAEELLRANGVLGRTGKYILIRCTPGKFGVEKQIDVWKKVADRCGLDTRSFDSAEGNISSLNKQLDFAPDENAPAMMLFIKGALQAGITLKSVKNICGAIDAYSGEDAVVQSIPGRMCGNAPDRRLATFPIFTRKKTVEKYVSEMRMLANNILPGVVQTRDVSDVKWVKASAPHCGSLNEFRTSRRAQFGELAEIGSNTIYGHTGKDFAEIILSGSWPDHSLRAVALGNKEPKFKYQRSVNRLLKKYPMLEKAGTVLWVDVVKKIKTKKSLVPKTVVNASKQRALARKFARKRKV